MPTNILGFGNKVKRSESLRSERSDASQKRVSFNRDVHVKCIPRGTLVDRNGKVVATTRGQDYSRDWLPVYKEPPRLEPEEAEAQADRLIRQIDNLVCTTSPTPVFYDTLSVDRARRQTRNNQNNSTLEWKTRSKTLPSSATKNNLDNKINNAERNRLEKNYRLNPVYEIQDTSLQRRKKLDPIYESSQSKTSRPTYLNINELNKVSRSNYMNTEIMALDTKDISSHSSQLPADKPPLTRNTVNSIVQQFNEEAIQRELMKQQMEKEGVKIPFPILSSPILKEPGNENSHNNNRPFSYTGASPGYLNLKKNVTQKVPSPILPTSLAPDYMLKSPSEVIYAQVVVNSKDAAGSNKQTVHTSVPSKSDVTNNTYSYSGKMDSRPVRGHNSLEEERIKDTVRMTSTTSTQDTDFHNSNSSQTYITSEEQVSRHLIKEPSPPSLSHKYSNFREDLENSTEDEDPESHLTKTIVNPTFRTTPERNVSQVTSHIPATNKYNKHVTTMKTSFEKNIKERNSQYPSTNNGNIVRVNVNGYKSQPSQGSPQRGVQRSSSSSPDRRQDSPAYISLSSSPERYRNSHGSKSPSPDRYYFGTKFEAENDLDNSRGMTRTNGNLAEKYAVSSVGKQSNALYEQKEESFTYKDTATTGVSLLSSTKLVKEVEKRRKSDLSPVNLLNGDTKVTKNMYQTQTDSSVKISHKDNNINFTNVNGKVAQKQNQVQKGKPELKKESKKERKEKNEKAKKRKIKIIFKQKEDSESESDRLKRFTEYKGSDYNTYESSDFRFGQLPEKKQQTPATHKFADHVTDSRRSATVEREKQKSRGSDVDNKLVNINIEIEDEDPEKVNKIRRQREQFFSAFLDESKDRMETSESEDYRGKNLEKTKEHQEQMSIGQFGKSWHHQETMDTDYRRELATANLSQDHVDAYPRELVTTTLPQHVDTHSSSEWSSQTLNRLEMKNKKNKQEDATRAKTLDRVELSRQKERKGKVDQTKKDDAREENGEKSAEKIAGVVRKPSFNVRYFGDTDQESQYSGPSVGSNKSRRRLELSRMKIRRSASSVAGARRELLVRGGREDSPRQDKQLPVSAASSMNSSESENGSHASRISQASQMSQASNSSNRSVYLHATTVADIPPSALNTTAAAQRRRSKSRDELSTIEEAEKPYSKKVSRSFSLLAPWRPRRHREQYSVHYDDPWGQGAAKPPKYPRKKQEEGSTESPRQEDAEDTVSPLPSIGEDKQVKKKQKKEKAVSRSTSMPKDSRLAGWFKKKKSPSDSGSNNL